MLVTGLVVFGAAVAVVTMRREPRAAGSSPERGASAELALSSAPSPSSTPPSSSAAASVAVRTSSDASTRKKPARRPCVVAVVGDSLTDTKSHGGKYVEYLQQKCPRSQFHNFGRGGKMVRQMRSRFADDIFGKDSPKFSHLVVWGGVNDLISANTVRRTVETISDDLAFMYAEGKREGMQVVAINVAPWGGAAEYDSKRLTMTLGLNEWILAQDDEGKVDYVVDAYRLLSCGNPQMLCKKYKFPFHDGLHFGRKAHDVVGAALFEGVFNRCL